MMPEDFSKALLKSAMSDAPPAAAKASAVFAAERVLHATANAASASAGAAGAKAAMGSKLVVAIAASAIFAGGAGVSGGYVWGRASVPSKVAHDESTANSAESAIAQPAPSSTSAPATIASTAASAASPEERAQPDVCEETTATESNACSTNGGHTVTVALKSTCSKELLDVFWVDTSCHEIFKGIVHPGEVFWQDTWDSHVFRLRDHATHKLVKEITPQAVGGAPDRAAYWKGPPTELPVVTVKEGDQPITETAPPECAHGGGRAAMMHVHNDRKDAPIVIMSVDGQCQEHFMRQLDGGAKADWHTSEGHAFRIRDVAGALLVDVPPTSLDTATYLSVP